MGSIHKGFVFSLVTVFSGLAIAANGNFGSEACDGSPEHPYLIEDAADLKAFAEKVNAETDGQPDAHAILTANIRLNGSAENGVQKQVAELSEPKDFSSLHFENWIPIGSAEHPFIGSFDGHYNNENHTVSGLYVNGGEYVGLFGAVAGGAVIRNVGVVDSYIKGENYIGGIVAVLYTDGGTYVHGGNITVENCYNAGTIVGSGSEIGGVVGKIGNDAENDVITINNCYNTGTLNGDKYVGGIFGRVSIAEGGTLKISGCYNTGAVTGSGSFVGGVTASLYARYGKNLSISDCYNTGSVKGGDDVGGVVGYISNYESGTDITVDNCYNIGSVVGTGSFVGGVVGYNYDGRISNCFFDTDFCKNCSAVVDADAFDPNCIHMFPRYEENPVKNVVGMTTEQVAKNKLPESFSSEIWSGGKRYLDNQSVVFKFPYLSAMEVESQPVVTGTLVTDDASSIVNESGKVNVTFNGENYVVYAPAVLFAKDGNSATIFGYSKQAASMPSKTVSGNVTLKRTLKKDVFSTMVLPFSSKTIPAGVKFYPFVVSCPNCHADEVPVSSTPATSLESNKLYLVKTDADASALVFDGGVFEPPVDDVVLQCNGWDVFGTYEYKTWSEDDEDLEYICGYAGLHDNENSKRAVGEFGRIGAGAYIYPFRAYMHVAPYLAPPPRMDAAALNSARAVAPAMTANVERNLPETITVVMVDSDGNVVENDRTAIGSINTRTGEFRATEKSYFDLNGRNFGHKKPSSKGSFYSK